ncbi:MAG: RNA-binding protein [Denitrovibrio sp.]|nr:MAG: RNA-binding protein [Denitrovibrio sp.]
MKELVEFIVRSLVDNQDAVSLKEVEGEKASILELRVDQSDLGKVIGKQGRTAKSIRTILNASGVKSGKKVVLEILE